MSLGDKIRELDEQVAEAVRRAVEDLRGEMRRRLDEATVDLQRRLGEVAPELPRSFVDEDHLRRIAEEAAAPSGEALEAAREEGRALGRDQGREEARRQAHDDMRSALSEIDRARGQGEVLQRLLDASAPYARRAAVLLLRDGRLAGWGVRGFDADPNTVRAVSISAAEAPWSVPAGGGVATAVPGPRCAALVSQLDSALPREGRVVPLVLRDRVAALLYADRPEASDPLDLEALQVLTYGAALALETLALREREATATLLPADVGADEAQPAEPEPEPPLAEAAAEEPEEPLLEVEPEEYDLTEEPRPAAGFGGEFELEVEEVEAPEELEAPVEVGEVEEPTGYEEPEGYDGGGGFEAEGATPKPLPEGPEVAAAGEETDVESPAGEEYEESVPVTEQEPETGFHAGFETTETAATPPHGDELMTRRHDYLEAVEEADARAAGEGGIGAEALDDEVFAETAFEDAPELEEPEPSAPREADAEPAAEEPSGATGPIPWRTETQDTTTVPPPAGPSEPTEPAEPTELGEPSEESAEETHAEAELEDRPEAGAVPPPPKPGGAVEPPADVEGPGWAFSAAREPVAEHEEGAHEEARRLARLLVSEIQLYNQDEVEEGRRNRDIYERLRDDIERSRQLYDERVEPGVRETTDYFYQELVRQLAAGDAKALGI